MRRPTRTAAFVAALGLSWSGRSATLVRWTMTGILGSNYTFFE